MIRNFTEHAANERTFLAWVRTGIAVIAFGFVLEKFNLFIRVLAANAPADIESKIRMDRLSGPIGRYEGLAFMLTGVILLGLGYWRFSRTERIIDEAAPRTTGGVQAEVAVTLILMLLVSAYCVSILIG
ncbi:MAG: YidH family protein [Rhodomicrobium sp.]